jgi:hypothetical protein
MDLPNEAGDESGEMLRRFLAGRDVVCPQCEYNLRDLMGERCPECGEGLVLRVNLAEVKQKLLIAGLVGLSAGAGLNGLLLIYAFILVLRRQDMGDVDHFLVVNAVGFLVESGAMGIWLWLWRRIRRAKVGVRFVLAVACWGLTVINIVVFSFVIRN